MTERIPPMNIEAEQATLGSLLIDPLAIIKVAPSLKPSDFYRESHAMIYAAILALANLGGGVDLITVMAELECSGELDGIGGLAYLTELIGSPRTSAHVEHYSRLVKGLAVQRRMITLGGKVALLGYEGDALGNGLADRVFTEFSELIADRSEMGQIYTLDGLRTIETPMALVESLLWGRNLIYGPPKGGKTRLLLQLAMCLVSGKDFLGYVVPEPARVLFVQRDMDLGGLAEWVKKAQDSYRVADDASLYFSDGRGIDLATVEGAARLGQLITQADAEVLILDCLRKLHTAEENSTTEMGEVLWKLDTLRDQHDLRSLVVNHHTRKLGVRERLTPQHARGAGNLIDWCDSSLGLDGREGNIQSKLLIEPRYGPKDEIKLVFDWDVFTYDVVAEEGSPGTTIVEMVLMRHGGRMARTELMAALAGEGVKERTAARALGRMLAEGMVEAKPSKERDPNAHHRAVDIVMARQSFPARWQDKKGGNDEEILF